ncbi:MAG TPA: ATP-binding protein [bacterium]|nr:ATP-binding protein [bacterium]
MARTAGPGAAGGPPPDGTPPALSAAEHARLLERIADLEGRLRQRDEQRRAMLHIMADLHDVNRRLGDQRKAMLHILVDYEQDRRRLAQQTERLDNSRRALLHILQDSHRSNLRLGQARSAMIHIMGDLHEMTMEMQRREQDLRDKQEQLVQAGKLATLGELTTGVAHELNNPLNNIGLFIGNVIDQIRIVGISRDVDLERITRDLDKATAQVRKATEIISHLRTFGRTAPVSREPVAINDVVRHSLSLMQEQLRLRDIDVVLDLAPEDPTVAASPIQLEQVFINLLTNARDALADVVPDAAGVPGPRRIEIRSSVRPGWAEVLVRDTGPGIPAGLERRIFDPFFTTKVVGKGTGLGLAITYGILKDHGGSIALVRRTEPGAAFLLQLPLLETAVPEAAAT